MLKVTFEIIPFGDEKHPRRREIGHLNIGLQRNVANVGQYISMMATDGHHTPPNEVVQIEGHPRDQGAFELVRRTLEAHLGPNDPGALSRDDLMNTLAAQSDTVMEAINTNAMDNRASLGTQGGGESEIEPKHTADVVHQEDKVTVYCANCKNTDPAKVVAIEYPYDSPHHYDGVSEYRCHLCNARTGRWTGRILLEDEPEKPLGQR